MPRLVEKLRSDLGKDLMSIRYSRKEVADYYSRFTAYYAPIDDLAKWSRELSVALARQNPAYVELDDGTPDPLHALADEVRTMRRRIGPTNKAACDHVDWVRDLMMPEIRLLPSTSSTSPGSTMLRSRSGSLGVNGS